VIVSIWKKSVASSPAAWMRRKVCQFMPIIDAVGGIDEFAPHAEVAAGRVLPADGRFTAQMLPAAEPADRQVPGPTALDVACYHDTGSVSGVLRISPAVNATAS
jgi:hypothetical protein